MPEESNGQSNCCAAPVTCEENKKWEGGKLVVVGTYWVCTKCQKACEAEWPDCIVDQLTRVRDLLSEAATSLRLHKTKTVPDFKIGLQCAGLLSEIHGWRCDADGALSLIHQSLLAEKHKAEGIYTWAEFAPKTGEMRCGTQRQGLNRGSHSHGPSFHPSEDDARQAALFHYGVIAQHFYIVEPFVPVADPVEQNIANAEHDATE